MLSLFRVVTTPFALSRELSQRRRTLRLRQVDLAAHIGVSDSALSRWERREASPSLDGFVAWAEELGLEVCLLPDLRKPPRQRAGVRSTEPRAWL